MKKTYYYIYKNWEFIIEVDENDTVAPLGGLPAEKVAKTWFYPDGKKFMHLTFLGINDDPDLMLCADACYDEYLQQKS